MNTKILKTAIVILILAIFFGGSYFMIQYRTFGGHRLSIAANTDFNYLEDLFQEEPEEVHPPHTAEIPVVKVPIIIYHSVRPYIPGESIMQDRYDITPELFEQQLVYLRDHGYTPINFDTLATDIKMGTTTPAKKPVALTFDDGWENQYKYAFPLLKKYHMNATFYIYTKPIDNKKPHFLSWDQVREMSAAGMTIGSHTLSHPFLKSLSLADMRKEIFDSKKVIEDKIGKPVLHFAQPFGYTSPEIESIIKEAGYVTARGTRKGVLHSQDDMFNIHGYFTSDSFNDFIYIMNR